MYIVMSGRVKVMKLKTKFDDDKKIKLAQKRRSSLGLFAFLDKQQCITPLASVSPIASQEINLESGQNQEPFDLPDFSKYPDLKINLVPSNPYQMTKQASVAIPDHFKISPS